MALFVEMVGCATSGALGVSNRDIAMTSAQYRLLWFELLVPNHDRHVTFRFHLTLAVFC